MTTEKKWYTIKVQSNREKNVSEKLKSDMLREFGEEVDFLIPKKSYMAVKNGKKIVKEQILYPGYLFVQTTSPDRLSYLIKSTNGASTIIKNSQGVPQPLRQSEVDAMIETEDVSPKIDKTKINHFNLEDFVEINDGPFAGFKGTIKTIVNERDKVKVEVKIFGRPTSVDLTFDDIIKCEDSAE